MIWPNGQNLPPGSGNSEAGAVLYEQLCIACHGAGGRGGPGGELAGGDPDLTTAQPDQTIGSYWPYATTLFDFIRRAMPLNAPGSLNDDQVYALVAWLLEINNVIEPGVTLDRDSLAAVRMPNVNGFTSIEGVHASSLQPTTPYAAKRRRHQQIFASSEKI